MKLMLSDKETKEVIEVFDLGDRNLSIEEFVKIANVADKKGFSIEVLFSRAVMADFGYILHRDLGRSIEELLGE